MSPSPGSRWPPLASNSGMSVSLPIIVTELCFMVEPRLEKQ